MDLGELYTHLNFILNRDQLGTPASPDMFNNLLRFHNREYYDDSYNELVKILAEKGKAMMDTFFQSASPMKRFYKKRDINLTTPTVNTKLSVPDDYARVLTLSAYSKNNWREVDILGELEFTRRTQNIFIKDPDEFPFSMEYYDHVFDITLGALTKTVFKVIPLGMRKYRLAYLTNVKEPYFDYCVDEQDNTVYMPPDSVLLLNQQPKPGATLKLNNVVLADNIVVDNNFHNTSRSVELDWNEEHKDYFLDAIIRDASIRARENISPNQPQK